MFCPMAANIEQVLQALGKMTEMLRLMAVNQEAQAQQAQHAARQAQQAQPGNRRGDERRGVGLDERYFRRVEKHESHNNWKDFSFQFATAVGAADSQVKKMLDLVTRAGRNPNWDDIFELYSDEEILTASNQICAALSLLVGGETMTMVRGVPVGEGWLAWNKIVSQFDPETPAKELLALMAETQSKQVRDISDLPSAIEHWESKVKILKEEHNADIDEKIKIALLTSMLPSDIQDYVFQQTDKDDFAEIRDKVVTLAVNRASLSRPKPLEVEQVARGERHSGEQHDDEENPEEDDNSINYVGGKSGGKHGKGGKEFGKSKGKGFQGYVTRAANWGMPRASARRVKGKGKGKFGVVIGTRAATGKAMAREQVRGRGLVFSATHWITS